MTRWQSAMASKRGPLDDLRCDCGDYVQWADELAGWHLCPLCLDAYRLEEQEAAVWEDWQGAWPLEEGRPVARQGGLDFLPPLGHSLRAGQPPQGAVKGEYTEHKKGVA